MNLFDKIGTVQSAKIFPLASLRQIALQTEGFFFIIHLQKQDICQLCDIIRKADACRGQDVRYIPYL